MEEHDKQKLLEEGLGRISIEQNGEEGGFCGDPARVGHSMVGRYF